MLLYILASKGVRLRKCFVVTYPVERSRLASLQPHGLYGHTSDRKTRIAIQAELASAQTRSFRQGDSTNSASRERQHNDEHLCEDGQCGCDECDEDLGNNVCNDCATREARKYANHVTVS